MTTHAPTAEQRAAIEFRGGGLAVLAGAGTGKTTTMVGRIASWIKEFPESKVLAVSFTERSALELAHRLDIVSSESDFPRRQVTVSTIHSFCFRVFQESAWTVGWLGNEKLLNESESEVLWREAFNELWCGPLDGGISKECETLLAMYSREELEKLIKKCHVLNSLNEGGGPSSGRIPSEATLLGALLVVAGFVGERIEREKKERGRLEFSDMEKFALKILQSPEASQKFRKKYDLVVVDECQDINPIQEKILRALAREDLSNLTIVGDPKQSIYRFRDADVSLFMRLSEELSARIHLHDNFRSHPSILKLVNDVCAEAFLQNCGTYEPLRAGLSREEGPNAVGVIEISEESKEVALAEHLARSWENNPDEEIVLLVRQLRGQEESIAKLEANGIRVIVESGDAFWTDPRTLEIIAMLKFWMIPENRLSAATFLCAPWMNVDSGELDRLFTQKDAHLWEAFLNLPHPVSDVLSRLSFEARPSDVLDALRKYPPAMNECGVVIDRLWTICEDCAYQGSSSFETISHLERLSEAHSREFRQVPPPVRGALRILTIHGTKGLEFGHVVLWDFDLKQRARGLAPLLYDRGEGLNLMERDEFGDWHRGELRQRWEERERTEIQKEELRLLYVALTRAKNRLTLVWTRYVEEKGKNAWRAWLAPIAKDVPRIEGVPRAGIARRMSVAPESPRSEGSKGSTPCPTTPIVWSRKRQSASEWDVARLCRRKYAWKFLGRFPNYEFGGNSKAELGVRVHKFLKDFESEGNSQELFTIFPKLPGWIERSDLMKSEALREFAFEAKDDQGVVTGVIDRINIGDEIVIVDFKIQTGVLSSNAELIDRYLPQLQTYAWGIRQCFPEYETKKLRGCLVQIHPDEIREIVVDEKNFEFPAIDSVIASGRKAVAASVDEWIERQDATPQIGGHCSYCEFRKICVDISRD